MGPPTSARVGFLLLNPGVGTEPAGRQVIVSPAEERRAGLAGTRVIRVRCGQRCAGLPAFEQRDVVSGSSPDGQYRSDGASRADLVSRYVDGRRGRAVLEELRIPGLVEFAIRRTAPGRPVGAYVTSRAGRVP